MVQSSCSRALNFLLMHSRRPHSVFFLLFPPLIAQTRRNSFLLHRPYIRVDELPLFDTLFTGVQRGGGGGPGSGLGVAGADPAAAGKARMWMLRALRDGRYPITSCACATLVAEIWSVFARLRSYLLMARVSLYSRVGCKYYQLCSKQVVHIYPSDEYIYIYKCSAEGP